MYDDVAYRAYLQWFHRNARTIIKPSLEDWNIGDLPSSDDEDVLVYDDYDEMTRHATQTERGPLQNYMVCNYFPEHSNLYE